jgi:6-methylsalicylate decarboxylase
MDRAGVQMQVLSACPQMPYAEDGQKATQAARFVNDQSAGLVQRRPDRFRAFATLPMPHLEESLREMGRALDDLGLAGVAMNTTVLGRALVEPGYEPVFAELNSKSAVLYLHPAGNSACSPLIGDYHLTWMVGAPVEDTISIMQLITHGIPTRYPDIKIINSHLGGALPMLLQRADDQYRPGASGARERRADPPAQPIARGQASRSLDVIGVVGVAARRSVRVEIGWGARRSPRCLAPLVPNKEPAAGVLHCCPSTRFRL